MAQLCLWTKIRTKQWLVLGTLAFQCMREGFLCPKCNNFACLHSRQDQNELHLKRWFFCAKIDIFCKSICPNISQRYSSVYTNIFVRQMDKTNYQSNQTWAKCYHTRCIFYLQFSYMYEYVPQFTYFASFDVLNRITSFKFTFYKAREIFTILLNWSLHPLGPLFQLAVKLRFS